MYIYNVTYRYCFCFLIKVPLYIITIIIIIRCITNNCNVSGLVILTDKQTSKDRNERIKI